MKVKGCIKHKGTAVRAIKKVSMSQMVKTNALFNKRGVQVSLANHNSHDVILMIAFCLATKDNEISISMKNR